MGAEQADADNGREHRRHVRASEQELCDVICANVKVALGRADDTSLDFTIETKRLFLSAWRLAAELGSRAVRAEHLIVALINSGQLVDETGQNQRLDRSDGMALLTGAVIRITHYRGGGEAAQSNIEKLKPVGLAAGWIGEAVRRASSSAHTVTITDILGVYQATDLSSDVHGNLVNRAQSS
jgi:hypothetical protein